MNKGCRTKKGTDLIEFDVVAVIMEECAKQRMLWEEFLYYKAELMDIADILLSCVLDKVN